jgi:hypothetical protein
MNFFPGHIARFGGQRNELVHVRRKICPSASDLNCSDLETMDQVIPIERREFSVTRRLVRWLDSE